MKIQPVYENKYIIIKNNNNKKVKTFVINNNIPCDVVHFTQKSKDNHAKGASDMEYADEYLSRIEKAENDKKVFAINQFNEFLIDSDVFFDDELLYIAQNMLEKAVQNKDSKIVSSYLTVVGTIANYFDCSEKIDYSILREKYSKLPDNDAKHLADELMNG